ncbi:WYL domain-containing protein [Bacteroidia bacterium]|nr:WYL domain-containing protein [Bacteroidia bacterium]
MLIIGGKSFVKHLLTDTYMTNKNMIRRDYILIRRLIANDYPSKAVLLRYLENHDIEIDSRTFDRDINSIRYNLDVNIEYDRNRNGYYIDKQDNKDFDKLLLFIGLAENADIILSSMKDKQELLKYLSVSPTTSFKGVELIAVLLQAIRNTLIVKFKHYNYNTKESTEYAAEPYLLKEFDGRWYLFAFVREKNAFRTFGLDRLTDLTVTDNKFLRTEKLAATIKRFDDIYGLVYMPEQQNPPLETVQFRCNADFMIDLLSALPLHHSQTIDGKTVSIQVIINPELENKLLSYGEHIEVLSPQSLRNRIHERLKTMIKQYNTIPTKVTQKRQPIN